MDWEKVGKTIITHRGYRNMSLKEFMKRVLTKLMSEGEDFRSKYGLFGDSDWMSDIAIAIIDAGYDAGSIVRDEEGFISELNVDWRKMKDITTGLINHIFNGGQ